MPKFFWYFLLFLSAPVFAGELPLSFTSASIANNMALGQTQILNFTIKNNVKNQTLPLKNIGIINDGDTQAAAVTTITENSCNQSLAPLETCSITINISNVSSGNLKRHLNIDYDGRAPLTSPLDITIAQANYTVLVYIVGSDLERKYQLATLNIAQMALVGSTGNMNVVIETGGANKPGWLTVQRKLVVPGDVLELQDLGSVNMASTSTIQDFFEWGITNFPADKYIAIFWNHGGGPNGGFGADENFSNASTPINQLSAAIQATVSTTGQQFELIGFDACLLGNLETLSGLYSYTNYFIASEDIEPGSGWQYNTFLQYVTLNPQATGLTIGEEIVNGYIAQNAGESTTLSVVDSSQVPNLLTAIGDFSTALAAHISTVADWKSVATGRIQSPDYYTSVWDMKSFDVVDLWSLGTNMPTEFTSDTTLQQASANLVTAVQNAVKYSSNSPNRKDSHGITVYFPSIMAAYQAGYPNTTILNGQNFYSTDYTNFISNYVNFYSTQTSSLIATPTSLNFDGTNYTATVTNDYDELYATVGNDSCTNVLDNNGDPLGTVPCYTSLQFTHITSSQGSGTTWNISLNKAATSSDWPLINGTPVLVIPDDTKPTDPNENTFLIPVKSLSLNANGYLNMIFVDDAYTVTGFQQVIGSSNTAGKITPINPGDEFEVRTYADDGGTWSLLPTTTIVTAPFIFTQGTVPSSSFNAFRFLVGDLTGALSITSGSESY